MQGAVGSGLRAKPPLSTLLRDHRVGAGGRGRRFARRAPRAAARGPARPPCPAPCQPCNPRCLLARRTLRLDSRVSLSAAARPATSCCSWACEASVASCHSSRRVDEECMLSFMSWRRAAERRRVGMLAAERVMLAGAGRVWHCRCPRHAALCTAPAVRERAGPGLLAPQPARATHIAVPVEIGHLAHQRLDRHARHVELLAHISVLQPAGPRRAVVCGCADAGRHQPPQELDCSCLGPWWAPPAPRLQPPPPDRHARQGLPAGTGQAANPPPPTLSDVMGSSCCRIWPSMPPMRCLSSFM